MSKLKVLVVEDEEDILEVIRYNLEQEGYEVISCMDGLEGLEQARKLKPDLVLLDIMLPGMDGVEVCRNLKEGDSTRRIPIIMVTAKGEEIDIVLGLGVGADDYIPKPFEPRELLARIRNALKQPIKIKRDVKTFGPLSYDVESRGFSVNGEVLNLRRTEALVLEALMQRPGSLVSRESLESKVYGYDKFVSSNSLESQVSRLRKNLSEHTDEIKIQTTRGLGYSLIKA